MLLETIPHCLQLISDILGSLDDVNYNQHRCGALKSRLIILNNCLTSQNIAQTANLNNLPLGLEKMQRLVLAFGNINLSKLCLQGHCDELDQMIYDFDHFLGHLIPSDAVTQVRAIRELSADYDQQKAADEGAIRENTKLYDTRIKAIQNALLLVNQDGQVYNDPLIEPSEIVTTSLIGSGAYGEVYDGTWKHKRCALKKLKDKLPVARVAVFKREVYAMHLLAKCNNIVALFGYYGVDDYYSIVMELAENGDLFAYIHDAERGSAIQPIQKHDIIRQIAYGISFLHQVGVIHRDLKSPNILLDRYLTAKITDFGLVKVENWQILSTLSKHTNQSVGSLQWKAPELFEQTRSHSTASDVYAFGVILWEILHQLVPFGQEDQNMIIQLVRNGVRESIRTDINPVYANLIENCWQQKPENRPTIAQVIRKLDHLRIDYLGLPQGDTKLHNPLLLAEEVPDSSTTYANNRTDDGSVKGEITNSVEAAQVKPASKWMSPKFYYAEVFLALCLALAAIVSELYLGLTLLNGVTN